MTLREQMDELERRARELIRIAPPNGDLHRKTCCELADEFDLWASSGTDQRFPIWLARVVEGELRDFDREQGSD